MLTAIREFFIFISDTSFKTKKYWTKRSLRWWPQLHKHYRGVTLLNRLIHAWAKDWLMPVHLTMTRSVHVCNFQLVRHYRDLHLRHVIMFSTVSVIFTVG